jgi:predicted RNase H-like HicB family nuclease
MYDVQVIVEQDEDGMYVASCPALEGCYTQGKTFEKAIENIRDVALMCLRELKEQKKPFQLKFPEVVGIKHIGVTL